MIKRKLAKFSFPTSLYLLTIFGIFLIGVYLLFVKDLKNKNRTSLHSIPTVILDSNERYIPYMGLKLTIPQKYQIQEGRVSTVLHGAYGDILIGKNATNFNNITDYYNLLKMRNHFEDTSYELIKINKYESIKANIPNHPTYFIYADHVVYVFETESPELEEDLEKIVNSFEYVPR